MVLRSFVFCGAFSFLRKAINDESDQAEYGCQREDDEGKRIIPLTERTAADGGGDDRGNPCRNRDEKPGGKPHIGKADKVGNQVLRRAGNQHQQKGDGIQTACAPEKFHGADLLA